MIDLLSFSAFGIYVSFTKSGTLHKEKLLKYDSLVNEGFSSLGLRTYFFYNSDKGFIEFYIKRLERGTF